MGLSQTEEASARNLEQTLAVLSREIVNELAKLKRVGGSDSSDTDWAAALAYIPARSQESYQILRAAMEEELDSADVGVETLRKSLSMKELHEQEVDSLSPPPLTLIILFNCPYLIHFFPPLLSVMAITRS